MIKLSKEEHIKSQDRVKAWHIVPNSEIVKAEVKFLKES